MDSRSRYSSAPFPSVTVDRETASSTRLAKIRRSDSAIFNASSIAWAMRQAPFRPGSSSNADTAGSDEASILDFVKRSNISNIPDFDPVKVVKNALSSLRNLWPLLQKSESTFPASASDFEQI